VVRQNIVRRNVWQDKVGFHVMAGKQREARRDRGRQEVIMFPMTHFLQISSTS
jgi:hypothetical protein